MRTMRRTRGHRVTMFCPRGRTMPDKLSSTLDFPLLWSPTTTMEGSLTGSWPCRISNSKRTIRNRRRTEGRGEGEKARRGRGHTTHFIHTIKERTDMFFVQAYEGHDGWRSSAVNSSFVVVLDAFL